MNMILSHENIVKVNDKNYKAGIKMKEKIEELLKNMSFWSRLQEEEQTILIQNAKILDYKAGDAVYSGGTQCLGMMLVLQGTLRTYLLSDEGKEITIYRLRQGDVCVLAASCILSAITFDVEMEAQTDASLLLLPAWVLSKLQDENVYVENYIYKEAAKRFSDVVEALQQMMFLSLTQRVASFLLDESAKQNTSSIIMTHEEIAKTIGSAREAVSRILKQLVKGGYISLNRGEIKIEEKAKLYQLL
ncbi:Crp/Fnr family transcriptional regulator [Blautia sp.]|uniref:Crp/Fnr family transcriptional regulator n=1 Tax=Blautia sp. TaxID=1955243 RepID=UPI002E772567|nr:Crp/Fnr family transcriptional regulator [Blautia sp.]